MAIVTTAPITGTWIPTVTGFSADPTMIIRYTKYNGLCYMQIMRSANGVSNAAATTVTLPFAAANIDEQVIPIQVASAGTIQAGYLVTRMNSNIADIKLAAGTDPSSTGAKSFQGNGFYETV